MITPEELDVDEQLARRVISTARSFAPCLDSLVGDARENAIAILDGVAAEAEARGARSVASQSVGTARVTYGSATSWFTDDDRDGLRALCQAAASGAGHPVGRFPKPAHALKKVWPEEA